VFKRKPQPSARELLEQRNATYRFYGMEKHVKELPPKRDKILRPVDKKPVHASEHQEQSAVITWWWRVHTTYQLPLFALFAIPNGGARDVITGSKLKAEGVRRGAPDLFLAQPSGKFHGLFIEMKAGNNGTTSEQAAFIAHLKKVGYEASVHWSAGSAIAAIEEYLQ
jgi:hypothetical protein